MNRLLMTLMRRLHKPADGEGGDLGGGAAAGAGAAASATVDMGGDGEFSLDDIAQAAGAEGGSEEIEEEESTTAAEGDDLGEYGLNTPEEREAAAAAKADPAAAAAAKGTEDDPVTTWEDNGVKVTAKASELRQAYSQVKHVAALTQQAGQREQMASQYAQQTHQYHQQAVQQVDAVLAVLQKELAESTPNPALIETNPQEYLRQQTLHAQRVSRFQEALQPKQQLGHQQQQMTAQQRDFAIRSENAKLLQAMPAWADKAVRAAEEGKVAQYLMKVGFAPIEVESMTDHRAFVVASDAAKWRALQAIKGQKKPPAPPPPKAIRPGPAPARTGTRDSLAQRSAERLRRNPSDEKGLVGLLGAHGI